MNADEVRVLGALIEKQVLTPDYYPLTFNGLLAACNQKTARNPVTDYDDKDITTALDGLREKGFAVQVSIVGSRVEKFRHRMNNFAELNSKEIALLCVLMLRGPQTVGELRQRSERLYPFVDLAETEETLKGLIECEAPEPLVAELPVQPGRKEKRYVHLFSDVSAVNVESETIVTLPSPGPSQVQERMEALELELGELRTAQTAMNEDLQSLKKELEAFKRQFE